MRRKVWINSFQTWMTLRILLYCVVYQFGFAMVLRLAEHAFRVAGEAGAPSGVAPFLFGLVAAVVMILLMITLDVMRFTHRLVGPLYRFRRTVQSLADGEPVPYVRLREHDFLLEFRDDFNRMLETLEEKGLIVVNGKKSQSVSQQALNDKAVNQPVETRVAAAAPCESSAG